MINPSELKKVDHLIVFAIRLNRANRATIFEIKEQLKHLWTRHNIKFPKTKLGFPSSSYFYQRIDRLIMLGVLERRNTREYGLKPDIFDSVSELNTAFIKSLLGDERV